MTKSNLPEDIRNLEIDWRATEFFGLADWATFEAGIEKGLEAAAKYIESLQNSAEQEVNSLNLTEYEIQVLLGTSMSPDQIFSLPMTWHRLYVLGLIDRTDGLAIITKKGRDVVDKMLGSICYGERIA